MAADSRLEILLTSGYLADGLRELCATVIDLAREQDCLNRYSTENLDVELFPDNLAYVMYTSGSTGTPKGIGIPHRAIARLVLGTNYIEIRPGDRVAHASNCSFDAATFEIWGALLNGAEVVGVPKEISVSTRDYAEVIRRVRINVIFLTTALFNQFAQTIPDVFRSVRYVLFGGEAVDPRSVNAILENGRPAHLLHMYGPTETTTYASWYPVLESTSAASTIPIGRPISNTQIYILDPDLRPVPPGIPGEIYIAGDGLARGYLNAPELAAEKFIPDPFAMTTGGRLYRTGDLARFRRDGAIEFIGRIDHQVKLRGFRIELGEIETVLKRHDSVRDVVVLLREDTAGVKLLCAYVGVHTGVARDVKELRRFLRDQLPEHMVPATLIVLDNLPITPNGKIDRDALLALREQNSGDVAEPPQSATEGLIASVWRDVLSLETVGVQDNFFDLGGHSLLMARIQTRLREALRTEVRMLDLFRFPTISALARHLQPTTETAARPAEAPAVSPQLQDRIAKQKEALERRAAIARSRGGSK